MEEPEVITEDKETLGMTEFKEIRKSLLRFGERLDTAFEISARGSTVQSEVFCGFVNFISCLYVLPVIPNQMAAAGYPKVASIEATALGCAIGNLLSSYVTNLPFIIAPPTAVSIYLAVALQKSNMNQYQGDSAVILSGFVLLIIGVIKPLSTLVSKLIPECIQASTAVGIGLITALAGLIELELVVTGKYTILELGLITPAIIIAMISVIILATAMHFHMKGSFMLSLCFGTIAWWWYSGSWPSSLYDYPHFSLNIAINTDPNVISLLLNLIFLYILTVNGIARSLSDLSSLTNIDGSIPRGSWLFIVCGVSTILSGYFSGPPILISPESAAGIKAGAKTGLSSLVCGLFFAFSIFLCPVLANVPPAGTSPLLILVGMMMFVNANRIKWSEPSEAVPAFFVLLLIPFTYSILVGVGFGYVLYIAISLFTGQLLDKTKETLTSIYQHGTAYYESSVLPMTLIAASHFYEHKVIVSNDQRYQDIDTDTSITGTGTDDKDSSDGIIVDKKDIVREETMEYESINEAISILHRNSTGNNNGSHNRGDSRGNMRLSAFQSFDLGHISTSSSSADLSGRHTNRRRSSSQRLSLGTRPRNGSLVDRIPMDLESGIQSMQA